MRPPSAVQAAGVDGAPEREAQRNRRQRRVDWRFLLPDMQPRTTLCLAGGRLARAVEAAFDVRPDAEAAAPYDLVVAANPDSSVLRAAFEALRPGGVCYAEWRWTGVAHARARLESAGFRGSEAYWVWPTVRAARCWVPLSSSEALNFFRQNPGLVRSPVRGARGVALHLLHRLALRIGLRRPICTVARKPTARGPHAAEDHPHTRPAACHAATAAGAAAAESALGLLTMGPRTTSKVVGFVFDPGGAEPRAVVKMPRVPEAAPGLRREAAALRALQDAACAEGVPRVLFQSEEGGGPMVGETALSGRSLAGLVRTRPYRAWAIQGAEWLARLAGTPGPQPSNRWRGRLVLPVVEAFEQHYGGRVDPGLLREARALLEQIPPLPLVPEQRDFGPWNVFVADDGRWNVVDWESAEPEGLPALDLLYFLAYLAFFDSGAMHSRRFRPIYRRLLDATTPYGRARRDALSFYGEAVGLAPEAVRPLGVLLWMIHAGAEYDRLRADAGGAGPIDPRQSVFVGLWEEEVRYGGGL